MKAAVLREYHRPLEFDDVPVPEPKEPHDVLVKVGAAGVCATDLHAIDGLMNSLLLVRLKKLGIHKVLDIIARAKAMRTGQPGGALLIGEINRGLPVGKRIRLRNVLEEEDVND